MITRSLRAWSPIAWGVVCSLVFTSTLSLTLAAAPTPVAKSTIDFNRDIRPILSDMCFTCHGPDEHERKGGLRLDVRENAIKPAKSGETAIVPGKHDVSELIRRITTPDEDDVMPPQKTGKKPNAKQVELLKQWIAEGAEYREHWAFIPPARSALPEVKDKNWPQTPIDRFILAKLEEEKIKPSPEASKRTLARRLSQDLTGLPPKPEEVEAFLADGSANAYEKLVDRLLASPHYGERMALDWLDASRFADTHGYHIDSGRDMTHWRKWVIDAYNNNQPFDQFTIDQLAGDLLPNATKEQKIASGFNRNHMINFEGGAIAEEYQTAYNLDRVNTTSTVWMGLTVACAQCHDHKYDPISQKDYFRLYAFFNSIREKGLDGNFGNAAPMLRLPTPEMEKEQVDLEKVLAEAKDTLKQREDEADAQQAAWEKTMRESGKTLKLPEDTLAHFALDGQIKDTDAKPAADSDEAKRWVEGKIGQALRWDGKEHAFEVADFPTLERTNAFSYGAWFKFEGSGGALVSRMEADSLRGYDILVSEGRIFVHLIHQWDSSALRVNTKSMVARSKWAHVMVTYDGSSRAEGVRVYINGRPQTLETTHNNLNDTIAANGPLNIGKRTGANYFNGIIDDIRFYSRILSAGEIEALYATPFLQTVSLAEDQRSEEQKNELRLYYRREFNPGVQIAQDKVNDASQKLDGFVKTIPTTMVMSELEKPRDTFLLVRGQYDQKGDQVTPGIPTRLGALPESEPANRLALAKWLVSPNQPLTARVIVNRYWQMYFGTGLVKTADDFGSQGEWPSHPALLDWLATEFMRSGWDIKAMQKLIVMSAAYRQSSDVTPDSHQRDPENRLLARGPRFRLQAEFIRDQALAVSGLLNDEIGGKSVSTYQPTGLWEELGMREDSKNWSAQFFVQSTGEDLYRRTMYTFWKRTSPPPQLATFDAPDRETCTVRRPRTNTPLQALILMNDPTYVEASRKFAERLLTEAKTTRERIALAFQLTLSRQPSKKESAILEDILKEQLAAYEKDKEAAAKLMKVGDSAYNDKLNTVELAAWTIIANTILNLDETVTKG